MDEISQVYQQLGELKGQMASVITQNTQLISRIESLDGRMEKQTEAITSGNNKEHREMWKELDGVKQDVRLIKFMAAAVGGAASILVQVATKYFFNL